MNEFNAKKLAKNEIVDFMKITEKHRETFNHVSALFHTIVGGTNDIAHTYMRDAIEKIKEAGLWKSHTNLTHPGKYFRPSKVKIMRPTSPK